MKVICVIPARYKSSRFPGKPLADIHGKPMIWWVYKNALKVKEFNNIYVATDNLKIKNTCEQLDLNVIMTSENNRTGTDRVAEVAKKIKSDLYINLQGDEPLIKPSTIKKCINPFLKNDKLDVINLMTKIKNKKDIVDTSVIKVVTNNRKKAIFFSRLPLPYPKSKFDFNYYKQICVYGYKPNSLKLFKKFKMGNIEKIEDIELLRFIENDIDIEMIEVDQDTISVDTPSDLERVKEILK